MLKFNFSYFMLAVLLFITELFIGFYMHDNFIRPYGGDVLVVILIYSSIKAIAPLPVLKTAIGVLLLAFTTEVLQYFKLVSLLGLQHSHVARVIIGTSFSVADLICYSAGIMLILFIENILTMHRSVQNKLKSRIKLYIWMVIAGLLVSGITAFPLETELAILMKHLPYQTPQLKLWLVAVYQALKHVNTNYPFLSYGTDWLAFAHIMLAILFIGPLKDPVKNIWIIQFGLIAAVGIFPLAFIAGAVRGIPLFWTLIDCSFGIVTLLLLIPCYRDIKKLNQPA